MKIENYGEIIAHFTKKKLLAYVEFGSYQGEYITVIDDGDNVLLYKGYYGSCSGCDWLQNEGETDWTSEKTLYEVSEEKLKEYFEKEAGHSFASIPKETIKRVDSDTFTSFLPANVRSEIYDFDGDKLHKEIIESLQEPVEELIDGTLEALDNLL